MDKKLFYNVNPSAVSQFIEETSNKGVIGLVHSGNEGEIGYIISKGKQYGLSSEDMNNKLSQYATNDEVNNKLSKYATTDSVKSMISNADQKISIDASKNSFVTADGKQYTLKFDEQTKQLSFNLYEPVTFNIAVDANEKATAFWSITGSDVTQYIGTSYTVTSSVTWIHEGSTKPTVSLNVVSGTYDTLVAYYYVNDTLHHTSQPFSSDYDHYTFNNMDLPIPGSKSKTGTVEWANKLTFRSDAVPATNYKVELWESPESENNPYIQTINVPAIVASSTVTAKVPVADISGTTHRLIRDVNYGSNFSRYNGWVLKAGTYGEIAVPTCLTKKKLELYEFNTKSTCTLVESNREMTVTINGKSCTTTYDIYCYGAVRKMLDADVTVDVNLV